MADEAATTTVDETNTTTDASESTADVQPTPEELASRLEGQKKVNKDLERKLTDARKAVERVNALEADLARLQGKESEYAESQKAREVESAALAKANDRILKAEIRAAAAGKLADPADALHYLDLSTFDVKDDGETDSAAIAKAVEDLIKNKPYLAAATAPKWPNIDANRNGTPPGNAPQLTAEDVKKLYADKKYDEVEAARKEGRLANILGATKS